MNYTDLRILQSAVGYEWGELASGVSKDDCAGCMDNNLSKPLDRRALVALLARWLSR